MIVKNLIEFVLFVLLAALLSSCNQTVATSKSDNIFISSDIFWENGSTLIYRYLKALESADISLHTNEEYDDDYNLVRNEIILIVQDSRKTYDKSYEEQLSIARKLCRIIYQELEYPDSYTAVEVYLYDGESNLILKDTQTFSD